MKGIGYSLNDIMDCTWLAAQQITTIENQILSVVLRFIIVLKI